MLNAKSLHLAESFFGLQKNIIASKYFLKPQITCLLLVFYPCLAPLLLSQTC